jgi:hypothetical protein
MSHCSLFKAVLQYIQETVIDKVIGIYFKYKYWGRCWELSLKETSWVRTRDEISLGWGESHAALDCVGSFIFYCDVCAGDGYSEYGEVNVINIINNILCSHRFCIKFNASTKSTRICFLLPYASSSIRRDVILLALIMQACSYSTNMSEILSFYFTIIPRISARDCHCHCHLPPQIWRFSRHCPP